MTATAARPSPVRWISVGAFAVWLFLFGTTYDYLPAFRRAWGFDLLRYQPDWIAWLLTGLALLITTEEVRRGVIATARSLRARVSALQPPLRGLLLFVGVFALLLLIRDQVPLRDSRVFVSILDGADRVFQPSPGGWLVLGWIFQGARALGLPGLPTAQLVLCATGAMTVVFVARAASLAAPEGRSSATIPLLAFSGGIGALLAGRLEIQALVLAACAVYLWSSLRFLTDPRSVVGPSLALGIVVWLEPFALCLLPGLVILTRGRGVGRPILALSLALLPLTVHLLSLLAVGAGEQPPLAIVMRGLGSLRGWVRPPGGPPGTGTQYVMLSGPHLKYLMNAGFILAAGAIPLGLALAAVYRRKLLESTPFVFLASSAAGLGVPVLTIRPVWGVFDWELFAITALMLTFATGVALSQLDDRDRRLHLVVAVAGLQLFFVGIPMVAIGQGAAVDAGPFDARRFHHRRIGAPPLQRRLRPRPRVSHSGSEASSLAFQYEGALEVERGT